MTTKLAIYMVLFHKRRPIMLGNMTKQTEGVLTLNWYGKDRSQEIYDSDAWWKSYKKQLFCQYKMLDFT